MLKHHAGHFDTEAISSMLAVFGHDAHALNVFVALKSLENEEDRLLSPRLQRDHLPELVNQMIGILVQDGHYAAFKALVPVKTIIISDNQRWPLQRWVKSMQYLLYKHHLGNSST